MQKEIEPNFSPERLKNALQFVVEQLAGTPEGDEARIQLEELTQRIESLESGESGYNKAGATAALNELLNKARSRPCDCGSCSNLQDQLSVLSNEDLILFAKISAHEANEAFVDRKEGVELVDKASKLISRQVKTIDILESKVDDLKKELEFERAKTQATSPKATPRKCLGDPPSSDRYVIVIEQDSSMVGMGCYSDKMGIWQIGSMKNNPDDEENLYWIEVPEIMSMS